MLIDNIDFSGLYRRQLSEARRTEKSPGHWDKRAEKLAVNCASPASNYLQQLLAGMDLQDATTLFDMGCGPGTVSLMLAGQLHTVYGIDYSQGMLDVAARRAEAQGITNVRWISRAWQDDWHDLPRCDIAVASRSTLVADLREALIKLNNQARLRVYTTHLVNSSFISPAIRQALGRPKSELPNYIYAINILYQMGINPRVDYIRGENSPQQCSTWECFEENIRWVAGELNAMEYRRLKEWYQQQNGRQLTPMRRDWALISWDSIPQGDIR